ncbi:MAG: phosphoadenosine phosphosulfate reductase [Alteromonadaceae bacterium]|jgi:phosphoadenosine phosphosulfate reductase
MSKPMINTDSTLANPFDLFFGLNTDEQKQIITHNNEMLAPQSAEQRVVWALNNLPGQSMISSSFGIQAAVMLHLVTRQYPDIPVVLLDTGYLFPETYQFIDKLTDRLKLNLKVYRAEQSPGWQEARFGKLWEQGVDGINKYNQMNKVDPLATALTDLNVSSWFSGLRREQSSSRADKGVVEVNRGTFKVYPIIDWTKRDVHEYLGKHDLPYHPLWEQGYVSVGDIQTSRPLQPGMSDEETRFHGLTRECGIHLGEGI